MASAEHERQTVRALILQGLPDAATAQYAGQTLRRIFTDTADISIESSGDGYWCLWATAPSLASLTPDTLVGQLFTTLVLYVIEAAQPQPQEMPYMTVAVTANSAQSPLTIQ